MTARAALRIPHLSNHLIHSALRGVVRFPAHITRLPHLANPLQLRPATAPFSSTMTPSSQSPGKDAIPSLSKRDPTISTRHNEADNLERILDVDGFKTWGFVIYRCTYQNDSDWEKFMARFLGSVPEFLEYYNGLDLLDKFSPTVLEDPSFEGATVAVLRDHFNQWVTTALKEEQGVDNGDRGQSSRYRLFVMVDQEALESVVSAPDDDEEAGFVRLVNGEWEPEELSEDELEENNGSLPEEEPLEGCTQHDVGWMKVLYRDVEAQGFVNLSDPFGWENYYSRPPEIQSID